MKKKILALMVLATYSGASYASATPITPNLSPDSVSISTSLGMLAGESKERVFEPSTGRKISQLDWKLKNVAVLKADISWDAYKFITLNARGWTSLASGSGHMDDYDWQNSKQSTWTDHSSHPDTRVNYANEYDLNVKGWIFQDESFKAGVMAGYQQTRFSWTANGGSYNYDNGTYKGKFPDGQAGIGYNQRFSMPYLGVVGQYRINNFEFNAQAKFSDWVRAHDNDEHYMRDLTFREKTSNSRYYGASIDAGYYVTKNAKVFAEFSYNKYEEAKGGTQIIDRESGESVNISGDAAGIANKNYTVTAGLQYRF